MSLFCNHELSFLHSSSQIIANIIPTVIVSPSLYLYVNVRCIDYNIMNSINVSTSIV